MSGHVAPGGQAIRVASLFLATLQLAPALRTVVRMRRCVVEQPSMLLQAAARRSMKSRWWCCRRAIQSQLQTLTVRSSLSDALDARQAAVMVRHEAAHLRLRHHRLLALAAVAEATMPRLLTRCGLRTLRESLERWADDEAATSHADRATLRSAIRRARAALHATPAGVCDVEQRLASLAQPPQDASRHMRRVAYAAVAAPTIVAAASLGDWASHVVVAALDAVTLRL